MKITVSDQAHKFAQEEMGLEKGDALRFTSKVYGKTAVHEGFSVAVSVEAPDEVIASTEKDGVLYYMDKHDEWFFNGYDFAVDYKPEEESFVYDFTPEA
ncbi:iron-sulfur cluster biosynthesis protein [Aerococcus urinaehominis]|uniref:Iron-sulfur cluster biosynthesis protein n=1 Tax=Aerococcus urinaehominis TaxID=128944 RepID=A0A109RI13_9LACT|nr:iron-sulfur cluster biosynthesis protein [Aerococcus urinaehominis]AMB99776.1 iron-sulfur cluster biosynthesis protein [Aerococcus urinaehominis]SDM09383.1 Uncharacterized protein YneR [Aerococcus urinaehominis]